MSAQRFDKVLVTGGRGFLGRHCLPLLDQHFTEVHAVTSGRIPSEDCDVCWHHADLLVPSHVERLVAQVQPSHLLHLAWITEPGLYWQSAENLHWVEASLHLVRQFASHGGKRLVIAGSCAEYDWNHGRCHEAHTPLAPRTLYGASKHALRTIVEAFAAAHNLSAASSRVFHLYGPGERSGRLVSSIVTSLLAGRAARCSHGTQIRDLLYVKDAADAHVRLLTSDLVGAVNIASGQSVALKDIAASIAAALGRPDLLHLGAIAPATDDPPLLVADVTRLVHELGWSPRYDLKRGLAETIDWWKSCQQSPCIVCPPVSSPAVAPLSSY